jgi:hypothetical protein
LLYRIVSDQSIFIGVARIRLKQGVYGDGHS